MRAAPGARKRDRPVRSGRERSGRERAGRRRALVRRSRAPPLRRAPRLGVDDLGSGDAAARRRLRAARPQRPRPAPLERGPQPGGRRVRGRRRRGHLGRRQRRCDAARCSSARSASALPSSPCSSSCRRSPRSSSPSPATPSRRPSPPSPSSWCCGRSRATASRRCSAGRGGGPGRSCRRSLNVLSRALPMLLLFSAFLFINAEAWQVAGTLSGVVFIAVLGIFFMLGAVVRADQDPGVDALAEPLRLLAGGRRPVAAAHRPSRCSTTSPNRPTATRTPAARPCASASTSGCCRCSPRRSR